MKKEGKEYDGDQFHVSELNLKNKEYSILTVEADRLQKKKYVLDSSDIYENAGLTSNRCKPCFYQKLLSSALGP